MDQLPALIDLARRAVRIARGNLIYAFSYNAVGLYLAATGRLTPVIAAALMVLSSAVVVLNSSRLREPAETPAADRVQPALRSRELEIGVGHGAR